MVRVRDYPVTFCRPAPFSGLHLPADGTAVVPLVVGPDVPDAVDVERGHRTVGTALAVLAALEDVVGDDDVVTARVRLAERRTAVEAVGRAGVGAQEVAVGDDV